MMANAHPKLPLSIKAAGGIEPFLNLPVQKEKHNGLGYDDLMKRHKLGVPISRIMKDFNVNSYNTVKGWLNYGK